ncbi:MAG TPA: hypothetical protein VN931_10650 [Fibrobacteria bacterium]|nr:hypothetical protein [Fibrobacteria bacterium]
MLRWIPLICSIVFVLGCGSASTVTSETPTDTLSAVRMIESRVAQDTTILGARFPTVVRLDDSTLRVEDYVAVTSGFADIPVVSASKDTLLVFVRNTVNVDWVAAFYLEAKVRFAGKCNHVRFHGDTTLRIGAGDTVLNLP